MSEAGYDVEAVGDGRAALAAVRAEPPDLLLGDVMMPDLDGFALLREIRADPVIAATPFLMLSARAGEEARVEGLDAGVDDSRVWKACFGSPGCEGRRPSRSNGAWRTRSTSPRIASAWRWKAAGWEAGTGT
ncbi:response regulator [Rhodoblastus acidophilus]|uniref:response regulator n=1 Tax=Rhodoblastus acidophilus TaxID=1074 RepID=UPI002224C815|nr:response regulator [Rhodoblastus acidophilus]